MDRNDRPGARAHRARNGRGLDVEGRAVDVGEHRRRAAVENGVGGRHPSERGHDHLVTRADAEGGEPEVEPGRTGGDGERMGNAVARGKGFLEGRHLGSLREPARREGFADRMPLFVTDAGRRDGDGTLSAYDAAARRRASSPLCAPRQSMRSCKPCARSTVAEKSISASARAVLPTRFFTNAGPAGS